MQRAGGANSRSPTPPLDEGGITRPQAGSLPAPLKPQGIPRDPAGPPAVQLRTEPPPPTDDEEWTLKLTAANLAAHTDEVRAEPFVETATPPSHLNI